MTVKPITWGDVFNRYLRKGHDHGSAAYAASQWEARCAREEAKLRQANPVLLPESRAALEQGGQS